MDTYHDGHEYLDTRRLWSTNFSDNNFQLTKDLNTGEVLEHLVVNPSEQQFYYATILGSPRDMRTILQSIVRPAAPRERSSEGMQSIYVSSGPLPLLWGEDFDSSQWFLLLFWSALSTSAGDTKTPPVADG